MADLVWIVGVAVEGGWMPEAIFRTEAEAVAEARDGEFVAAVAVGERIPEDARDAIKIYWPKQERWEESTLFKMRQQGSNG